MASTPTPPPHFSSLTSRTANSNQRQNRQNTTNTTNNLRSQQHRRQNRNRWYSSPRFYHASGSGPGGVPSAAAAAASFSPSLSPFVGHRTTHLAPEFSGRRSTRRLGKMNSGGPRAVPNNQQHSKVAEEALHCLRNAGNDVAAVDRILLSYEHRLDEGVSDYVYMIKDYANHSGEYMLADRTYDFAMRRVARNAEEMGKLTSNIIRTLGRLRKIDHACELFRLAINAGYGRTVFTVSAMISALGKNKMFPEAVHLFRSMGQFGLSPNLIIYNAIIDGGAKAEVDFDNVVQFFEDMKVTPGCQPDRITYNSLLATCVPRGRWKMSEKLMAEMDRDGIDLDVYTYNTYLDALCKGGRMDTAKWVLEVEMPARNIRPNVVTFSTLMDGYAKFNLLEEALSVYTEMERLLICLDRVSYNTLVGVYAKLGWFDEAMRTCQEMENCGIRNDVVTYNALIDGFGKHGEYVHVRNLFDEMKERKIWPNELTYSTMIKAYTKGKMYAEAMSFYREFRQQGLETDVVFYSTLIDSLSKNGLVESSMQLLDAMTTEGIRPNVVTYNSIIDAFRPREASAQECGVGSSSQANEYQFEPSSSSSHDPIMLIFQQLASSPHREKDKRGRQDNFSILQLFQRMHEMQVKPNVVTFSAILNACSHCESLQDASELLEQLRLFDGQAYGVAHGLLMGYGESVLRGARVLFDEIKDMDSSTASAFFNALTDMLWHFGQRHGAQLVVHEGKERRVWKCFSWNETSLDLHLMSCGAACAMVHSWLCDMRTVIFKGNELPAMLNILTGWGRHSKVVGNGTLRKAVEALLNGMGAPFQMAEHNLGRFISNGPVLTAWLREPSTLNLLVLHDCIVNGRQVVNAQSDDQVFGLPALCL
ncbi:hypothetical protein RJT34_18471 [Clitoria ternatea]|uniref:Smr domain-containing protein n=1 Tax=Clitoria ternatea TaxID=43366 RepID=A0AAN9JCE2_CLITE